MGHYNRISFLTSSGDLPVKAGGEKVFVKRPNRKTSLNVSAGEYVVFNPDKNITLAVEDLAGANKISWAVGVNNNGKTPEQKLTGPATDLVYLGGHNFNLCDNKIQATSTPSNYGCPVVKDYYIDCVDLDERYDLTVRVEDGITKSFLPQNDFFDYTFEAEVSTDECGDCTQEIACEDLICQWVDKINNGFIKDRDGLTLDIIQSGQFNDRYQPFRAAQIYSETYTYDLSYISNDCDPCAYISPIGGVTVDGVTTTFDNTTVTVGAAEVTPIEYVKEITDLINEALKPIGGSAYFRASTLACGPHILEINTCDTGFALLDDGGSTIAKTSTDSNSAAFPKDAYCKNCSGSPADDAPTCGIRIFFDQPEWECFCEGPEKNWTEKLNYYGRSGDAVISTTDRKVKFWEKEVCRQELPIGMGYMIQLHELAKKHNGGPGGDYRYSNRTIGRIPHQDEFSRYKNITTKCDEMYCQISVLTTGSNPREKYNQTTLLQNTDLSFLSIPQGDTTTQASVELYINKLQELSLCAPGYVSCDKAINDSVTATIGVSTTVDVAANDTIACPEGSLTYETKRTDGVSVTGITGSTFTYTASEEVFSIVYDVFCNGRYVDSGVVKGTATPA